MRAMGMGRRFFLCCGYAVVLLAAAMLGLHALGLTGAGGGDFAAWPLRGIGVTPGNAAQAAPVPADDLPIAEARAIQDAINRGDFATAADLASAALAASRPEAWSFYPFADIMNTVSDLTDPSFETRLTAWVDGDASKPLPLLVRAQYFQDMAWYRRGHRFATDVGQDAMQAFAANLQKARSDVDRALRLDPANVYAHYLRLDILRGYGMTPVLKAAFEESAGRYPDFMLSANIVLSALQPKWGGNVGSMYAFVDWMTKGAAADSPRKLLDLDLYRFLLETAAIDCDNQSKDADKFAACIQTDMKQNVTADLESRVLRALELFGRQNDYQTNIAVEYILSAMLSTSGGDVYSGPVLQAAANSYNADARLRQDAAAGHNYMIDKLVAQSWLQKGFDDNALTKYREALLHIGAATFPSEGQRSIATAQIHEQLASLYDRNKRMPEMMTAAKTALDLGGGIYNRIYTCYGYHQLKQFGDAIDECTRAIADHQSSVRARYWRGLSYRALKRDDDAARDLTIVADSQDWVRFSAATELEMIHFDGNDQQGALEILNKYPYLYDVKLSGKSNVAVSYNNRCYAYMELGKLRQALDDCNASLANGSIPDAYMKQQQLLKRLAAQP